MAQAQSGSATDLRIVKDPTTPKTEAIIDEVLDDPEASNPTIADRVEDRLGERPDPSWVSRVRRKHLTEPEPGGGEEAAVDVERPSNKIDDLIDRLDRVEGKVEDVGSVEDVDRAIDAVDDLTEAVDALAAEVREVKASVALIEDMVARDINDEVVSHVLKKELDRIDGPNV